MTIKYESFGINIEFRQNEKNTLYIKYLHIFIAHSFTPSRLHFLEKLIVFLGLMQLSFIKNINLFFRM